MSSRHRSASFVVSGLSVLVAVGCGVGQPAPVSPNEIPALEARVQEEPTNGDLLLRYAAALYSAGRCDTAVTVAERGARLRPEDAIGPLVIGQCREQGGELDEAITVYERFMASHPGARGIGAVRGRHTIARRAQATAAARQALAMEDSLAVVPADPEAVGVLPLLVAGDSSYRPLSIGLAELIMADLGLIERFRMVERLQLQALMSELKLTESDVIESGSAPRLGRLARAGRLVQGTAAIPGDGSTRLEASVVLQTGEVVGPASSRGEFEDLIRLEKELVLGIASQLGYQLTAAERQRILENGTQSLAAFLAYADGLAAESDGDFAAAARHYGRAVSADPGFTAAGARQRAVEDAEIVSAATPGDVTVLGEATAPAAEAPVSTRTAEAITTAVIDVLGTQAERATATAGDGSDQTLDATLSNTATPPSTPSNFPPRIIVNVWIRVP